MNRPVLARDPAEGEDELPIGDPPEDDGEDIEDEDWEDDDDEPMQVGRAVESLARATAVTVTSRVPPR